eukprot:18648_1
MTKKERSMVLFGVKSLKDNVLQDFTTTMDIAWADEHDFVLLDDRSGDQDPRISEAGLKTLKRFVQDKSVTPEMSVPIFDRSDGKTKSIEMKELFKHGDLFTRFLHEQDIFKNGADVSAFFDGNTAVGDVWNKKVYVLDKNPKTPIDTKGVLHEEGVFNLP